MRRRGALLAFAFLLALPMSGAEVAGAGVAGAAGDNGASCPAAPPVVLSLPRLKAAMARGEPVVIAALGSSSTRGAGASDPAHAYPALLERILARRLPAVRVSVVNRGIDGQEAPDGLARLARDVVPLHPHLVIWQVGTNAAIRGLDPEHFRDAVVTGVARLHAADVVLMDSQRSRRVLEAPHRARIEQALQSAVRATGAPLFSRAALMEAWRSAGRPYEDFIAADGLHHNDLGYRCLAEALANSIVAALAPAP